MTQDLCWLSLFCERDLSLATPSNLAGYPPLLSFIRLHVLQRRNSALMVRKRALSIAGLPPTKRQAVESWIQSSQAGGLSPPLQATRKRKINSIHNESSTVCQYPRKRHHSAVPLTRQALIQ